MDVSNWTLTAHPTQQAIFSSVKIPAGTKLAAGGFYLLGLANSGLAAPARTGDTTIHVRSTTGMSPGDTIEIGAGAGARDSQDCKCRDGGGHHYGRVATRPGGSRNHHPRGVDQRAFR